MNQAVSIKLKLKSGQCKSDSSLSRVMGQYQINLKKFITLFNNESQMKYKDGILFYIRVLKVNKDVFSIIFKSPSLNFLIKNLAIYENMFYIFTMELLYDLYCIYDKLSNNKILLKSFFGSLCSFQNLKYKI